MEPTWSTAPKFFRSLRALWSGSRSFFDVCKAIETCTSLEEIRSTCRRHLSMMPKTLDRKPYAEVFLLEWTLMTVQSDLLVMAVGLLEIGVRFFWDLRLERPMSCSFCSALSGGSGVTTVPLPLWLLTFLIRMGIAALFTCSTLRSSISIVLKHRLKEQTNTLGWSTSDP